MKKEIKIESFGEIDIFGVSDINKLIAELMIMRDKGATEVSFSGTTDGWHEYVESASIESIRKKQRNFPTNR